MYRFFCHSFLYKFRFLDPNRLWLWIFLTIWWLKFPFYSLAKLIESRMVAATINIYAHCVCDTTPASQTNFSKDFPLICFPFIKFSNFSSKLNNFRCGNSPLFVRMFDSSFKTKHLDQRQITSAMKLLNFGQKYFPNILFKILPENGVYTRKEPVIFITQNK